MWISVTSGIWKLSAHTVEGGRQFHVWSGDTFGWVVLTDPTGPPKHVERRMTKRLFKKRMKLQIGK